MSKITYDMVRQSPEIRTYIEQADASLSAMGFTEHSFAHVERAAQVSSKLLADLGYSEREVELARIAGFMHDIGNVVNRIDHAQSGAMMAFRILDKWGMDPADTALVVTAIGNHDEHTAFPVNAVSAALILADKTDVRRSRVRQKPHAMFDIHDRVNYSVTESRVDLDTEKHEFTEILTLDTAICPVLEYFEIFMERMLLCQKAAAHLGLSFRLRVNGQNIL